MLFIKAGKRIEEKWIECCMSDSIRNVVISKSKIAKNAQKLQKVEQNYSNIAQ